MQAVDGRESASEAKRASGLDRVLVCRPFEHSIMISRWSSLLSAGVLVFPLQIKPRLGGQLMSSAP